MIVLCFSMQEGNFIEHANAKFHVFIIQCTRARFH